MPVVDKRWHVLPQLTPEVERALHGYPPVLRQILFNRGYSTSAEAARYLEARPPENVDPFCMLGLPEAVERLNQAIKLRQPIAIYGDYDVDGVTATALLVQVFQKLGALVQGYIPNRFDEGYGLNYEALDSLHTNGVKVVVTVDCGVRSPKEAAYARQIGLDMIITDHHQPSEELPDAFAIINPKQVGDPYPDKNLAGVGLAYKLAGAFVTYLRHQGQPVPDDLDVPETLDLVALGTVADLAPLVGENRALVKAGLECIRKPKRLGLRALIGVGGINPAKINAWDIGFVLGPRLNAAGRLESALDAFRLLTTNNLADAGLLAQKLDVQNRARQQMTREIQVLAEQLALIEDPNPQLLFAVHPDFNPGVIGLAASRLVEQYYRPAIVASQGDVYTRGSCRSISEFHITEALDKCADLLEHHGGHAAAAGFTVKNENVPALHQRLKRIVLEQLVDMDLRPSLVADAEITLTTLQPQLLDYLDWLQPTGYGNNPALFLSRDLEVVDYRTVGKDASHLKLRVTDGWETRDAIAFRQGQWSSQMPAMVDMMYTFESNEYNGRTTMQLNVRDLKPSGT